MFDDNQSAPQGGVPQNLPLGEPEDLFAESDGVSAPASPMTPTSGPTAGGTSALDAGILKPKASPELPPLMPFPDQSHPQMSNAPVQNMGTDQPTLTMREPSMSRGILVAIIVILAVILLGGASWWVYRYLQVPKQEVVDINSGSFDTPVEETRTSPQDTSSVPTEVPIDESGPDEVADTSSTQPVDETVLFGNTPDSDNDGLDDKREATLGTNPEKVDSDNDELSDGDEVIIWGTNPLNSDTDGDTYLDGKEVKSGFSPKGSGKLFEVKTTTSS